MDLGYTAYLKTRLLLLITVREGGWADTETQCYPGRMLVLLAILGLTSWELSQRGGGCVMNLDSPIQRTRTWSEPCHSLLRHGLPLYLQVGTVSGVLTQKLRLDPDHPLRFQFPRTSSSASLPGLTRNSGSLQPAPALIRGSFLSSQGPGCSHLCHGGDSTQSQHHLPPRTHPSVCPQVTATCRPTYTSVPGSTENLGVGRK